MFHATLAVPKQVLRDQEDRTWMSIGFTIVSRFGRVLKDLRERFGVRLKHAEPD